MVSHTFSNSKILLLLGLNSFKYIFMNFFVGWDTFHLIATVCVVYAILLVFGGSVIGAILTLVFTMSYLLLGT